MESWLPWLVDGQQLITDVLPANAKVAWSSRAACATAPTTCWPRRTTWPARWPAPGRATPSKTFPRLHADDRPVLLASGQAMWTISNARGPTRRW
jgi:hypothetical protein